VGCLSAAAELSNLGGAGWARGRETSVVCSSVVRWVFEKPARSRGVRCRRGPQLVLRLSLCSRPGATQRSISVAPQSTASASPHRRTCPLVRGMGGPPIHEQSESLPTLLSRAYHLSFINSNPIAKNGFIPVPQLAHLLSLQPFVALPPLIKGERRWVGLCVRLLFHAGAVPA